MSLTTGEGYGSQRFVRQYGLTPSYVIADPFPETKNDPECLAKVRRAAAGLGLPVIEMKELWRASEDFGYYTKACPGAIFYLGNARPMRRFTRAAMILMTAISDAPWTCFVRSWTSDCRENSEGRKNWPA